jgi:DNA-binding response OmpR family regulator
MARVLVADDDPAIVSVVRYRLERDGHDVTTALDGAEALTCIAADRPDAVVLDISMPEVSGIDVLESLAAEPGLCDIPVLVLTARVDQAQLVGRLGCPVMEKPFSPTDLTRRVEALIAGV